MKLPFSLLLWLVSAALGLQAQSSVWKVSQGDDSIYIGGTCHILRKSDFPLPAEFDMAYAESQVLIFEVDPESMQDPATGIQLMQSCMYTDGRSLKTVLSDEAYEALAEQGKKSNLPIEILNGMKPGMAVMMITLQELIKHGVQELGVDMHFAEKAKADGKAFRGLETVDFQIDMLASMGEGNESDYVLYGLMDLKNIDQYFDQLISYWRKGDMDGLEKLVVKDMKTFPELYEELLVKRNQAWMADIGKMLKSPEVELILVGAGHAVGDDGLLSLLKKKGCSVEQIVAPAN